MIIVSSRRRALMRAGRTLLVLAPLVLALGCGSSSTTNPSTVNVPFSQTDLTVGNGATAVAGKSSTVSYTGWLYDASKTDNKGTQFDSGAAFVFTLGVGSVIPGWDQGIVGMKVGGQRRLVIPPNLAYGAAGRPPAIPGNATLVFDVSLLAVQ